MCVWVSSAAQLFRLNVSMLFPFWKKKKDKLSHFLSIYLSRSEGLVTTQRNLKGKKQIKTTFFQHCVCTVGPRELLGLEKQLGKLLLSRGNSFPRIYLEMVRWELSCRFTVTLHPSRSSAGPPWMDMPKVLAHMPRLVATRNRNMLDAWFYAYGSLWWQYLN